MMARDILESSDARVELVVRSPQAEFNLDVLATYSKTEPFLASPDVRRSFLEKVGIFVVWPYLRASFLRFVPVSTWNRYAYRSSATERCRWAKPNQRTNLGRQHDQPTQQEAD